MHPAQGQLLQENPEGYAYWKRLSQANVAVCQALDAGDPVLIGVRHWVAERWGSYDLPALNRAVEWLVADYGMTLQQAENITLPDLLTKKRFQKGV
jgi:hypothetical protein